VSRGRTVRAVSVLSALVLAAACPARCQDRVALLVGVEKYDPSCLVPLTRAEDDAESIGRSLERLGFSVVIMTSAATLDSRRPTTPTAILDQVDKRLADRSDADTVMVAFFGHGVQFTADPPDAGGAKEVWLCPEQARLEDRGSLLPLSAVLARLDRCGAGRKLLLVDACRREGDPPADGPRAGLLEPPGSAVKRPAIPAGVAAIFSCRAGERSSEIPAAGHGVFATAVLDYLEGRAPAARYPGDELVLTEFAGHVRGKTRDTAEVRLDRVQMPDVVLPEGPAGVWPLGPLAAAKATAAGAASPTATPPPRPFEALSPNVNGRILVGKAVDSPARLAEIDAAIARFRKGDVDGCHAALERAKAAEPRLPPTGVTVSKLWLGLNDLATALEELDDTIARVPGDPEPHLMLGDLAFQEKKVDEAAEHFSRATELTAAFTESPGRRRDFEIRCAAGNAAVAEARTQWGKAHGHLLTWLKLDPRNPNAHQRLGIVLFKLGRTNEALAEFQAAKRLDSRCVLPEIAMARLYDEAKLQPAARTMVERALKAAGHDAAVLLAAAQWYLGRGEFATVRSLIDRALAMPDTFVANTVEANFLRGQLARHEGDLATAERFIVAAHAQSSGGFPITNALALVLVESADTSKRTRALDLAEADVARTRDDDGQHALARETLAWVHHRLGRPEEAFRALDELSRSEALSKDGIFSYAGVLVDRGDTATARRLLEDLLSQDAVFVRRRDAVALLEKLGRETP